MQQDGGCLHGSLEEASRKSDTTTFGEEWKVKQAGQQAWTTMERMQQDGVECLVGLRTSSEEHSR